MRKYHLSPQGISPLFVGITSFFVVFLMIANITANRLVNLFGFTLSAAIFIFPITYIFGDILTEVYGYKRTRLVIWLGFAANIIMALYFNFIIKLPYPADITDNKAYITVLGSTPLIVFASMVGYFLGEFGNSMTLSVLKKMTKGKCLWSRTIGSTVVGQLLDTVVFMSIAFYSLPRPLLISLIITQYILKVLYEVIATPITYIVVAKIKKVERVDTYDYGVKYNPFSFDIAYKKN